MVPGPCATSAPLLSPFSTSPNRGYVSSVPRVHRRVRGGLVEGARRRHAVAFKGVVVGRSRLDRTGEARCRGRRRRAGRGARLTPRRHCPFWRNSTSLLLAVRPSSSSSSSSSSASPAVRLLVARAPVCDTSARR